MAFDQYNNLGGQDGQYVWFESNVYHGPFMDANGNLYSMFEVSDDPMAVDSGPAVVKSTNGGDTWATINDAGAPAWSTWGDMEGAQVVLVPGFLYCLSHRSGTSVEFYIFRTSDHGTNPDTWGTPENLTASGSASQQGAFLVARSDASLVGGYRSGTNIGYRVRTGTTWGSESSLTVASATLSGPMAVVGESDTTHLFANDVTNNNLRWWTLTSGGSLSGPTTIATGLKANANANAIVSVPRYWNDGGTEHIYVAYMKNDNSLALVEIVDGTPQSEEAITATAVGWSEGATTSLSPVAAFANDGGELHCLYADDATLDLWHTIRDLGTGNWETAVEERDAIACEYVNANVIDDHPDGKVLAVVLCDNSSAVANGWTKYGHLVLTEPEPPGPPGPSVVGLFDSELRSEAWFDETLVPEGWFDQESIPLLESDLGVGAAVSVSVHGQLTTTGNQKKAFASVSLTAHPSLNRVSRKDSFATANITSHPAITRVSLKGGRSTTALTVHSILTSVGLKSNPVFISTRSLLATSMRKGALSVAGIASHPTLVRQSRKGALRTTLMQATPILVRTSRKGSVVVVIIDANPALTTTIRKGALQLAPTLVHAILEAIGVIPAQSQPKLIGQIIFAATGTKAATRAIAITSHPVIVRVSGRSVFRTVILQVRPTFAIKSYKGTTVVVHVLNTALGRKGGFATTSVVNHPNIVITSTVGQPGQLVFRVNYQGHVSESGYGTIREPTTGRVG